MEKPQSIRTFDLCFLAGYFGCALASVISLREILHNLAMQHVGATTAGRVGTVMGFVGVSLLPLLLWYFISMKRSNVARWIMVVLIAISALGILISFSSVSPNPTLRGFPLMLNTLGTAGEVVAVFFLFRADAKPWFAKYPAPPYAPYGAPPSQPYPSQAYYPPQGNYPPAGAYPPPTGYQGPGGYPPQGAAGQPWPPQSYPPQGR